jgi:hypothetical protein
MQPAQLHRGWRWTLLAGGVLGGVCILLTPQTAAIADASDPAAVVRVEEDWVLVLNQPGEEVNSPQFHTVMSPRPHTSGPYMQVSWNYRELPDFEAGGLQLQAWYDDDCISSRDVYEESLSSQAETITWTQELKTTGNELLFRILNGQATSWGSFAGEYVVVSSGADYPNLSGYSPFVSRANSWISYGSNRVTKLVIQEVRWYGAGDELLYHRTEPITVFPSTQHQAN